MRIHFLMFTTLLLAIQILFAQSPQPYINDFDDGALQDLTLADPLADAGLAEPGSMVINENGQLVVTGNSNGNFPVGRSRAAAMPEGMILSDFQIETDVVRWDRSGMFRAAMLMARTRHVGYLTMETYMVFYDTSNRRVEIWRVSNEIQGVNLANSQSFDRPDEGFRLTFTGIGTKLTASAHTLEGELLASTSTDDHTYTEGGLGIGVVGDHTNMTVTFDNLRVFDPAHPPQRDPDHPFSIDWVKVSGTTLTLGLTGINEGDPTEVQSSPDLQQWELFDTPTVDRDRSITIASPDSERYFRIRIP